MKETVWHKGNAWRLPVMILGRVPVLLLARGFLWIGQKLDDVGSAIPGLTKERG